MKEEQTCFNCIHFIQHYRKSADKIKEVYCGHCLHKRSTLKRDYKGCEIWEDNTPAKEQFKKSLQYNLEVALNDIHNIMVVLSQEK